jgi:hypothetical protein
VRGAVPSLRAAYGYALAAAVGHQLGIPVSPREAGGRVQEIAEGGEAAAVALCRALAEERERVTGELRAAQIRRSVRPRPGNPVDRADGALDDAGCRMLSCRGIGDAMFEVRFQLDGQRYCCVIEGNTLQVIDAGICLSGADRELTLDSLPSVIREAERTNRLNITRHA